MITRHQKRVLDFIKSYTKKKGYAPSLEDIKKKIGFASVSTAHHYVKKLQENGYLKKQSHLPRAIEIYESEPMLQINILGNIAAGQPIEAIEEKESIAIPKVKLPKSGDFYGLRVVGDSMIEENINDGDIIIVKNQPTANNGQKVVALIDNNEVTLKKIYKEKNRIRLQPANAKLDPIYVEPENLMVQGVVIDVIKNITPKVEEEIEIEKYKELPLNKIICGDVINEIKRLPDESCDVVIIDPPYNIGKDFGNNIDKRELNDYVHWSKIWINESIRALKPTGTIFIYGFSEILAYLSIEIPLQKRWLIWHYTNKNVASLNFWQRSHEAIICAWKNKPVFNRDEVREPYTESFLNGAAGKVRRGTVGRFSRNGKETIYKAHEKGALPRDVIKIPALAGGAGMSERYFLCKTCNEVYSPKELKKHQDHDILKHPTQKPLELSRKLIKSCTPKQNGIILVPFVGTGSECIAAKELGYSFIGFEINPDYIKIANKMLDDSNKLGGPAKNEVKKSVPIKEQDIKKYLNTIYHGDIIELLKKLPDKSIDMVFGDPDYNVGIKYGENTYTKSFEEYIDWYIELVKESMRVLKDDGNLFIMNYPKQNAHLRVKYLDNEYPLITENVWVYNSNVGHSPKRFTTAHRTILHVRKTKDNKFYKDNVALPYQNPTDKRILQNLKNGSKGRMPYTWYYFDLVKNVSKEKTYHACQIPQKLTEMLIKSCTVSEDIVLVLFGGSGAELEMCKKFKRQYISAEIDPKYYEIITDRLKNGYIKPQYKLQLGKNKREEAPSPLPLFSKAG